MRLSKEILEKNLAALTAQMGNSLFEAGKVVGRTEGQIAILEQLVKVADPEAEVAKLAEEAGLRIAAEDTEPDTGAEAGQGQ